METELKIHILIDNKEYILHQETMTGAQLKQLAGIQEANLLFREVHGPGEDELVRSDAAVHLHNGEHFYDMPPGNFGVARSA
jgi:hypothetical protein